MENEQKPDEVKDETVVDEQVTEQAEATEAEQETEREKNLKAETRRKQEELIRLREENERLRNVQPVSEVENIDKQLRRMNDRELDGYLNNAQYANLHIAIREIQDERKYDRYHAKKEEQRARLDAEIEVETKFPEVLVPTHPMALKTKELLRLHHLENHPQGRLIAARLAASELKQSKANAAGRKAEQNRQADVKANFGGESGRPAPKVSDAAKDEELKQRAKAGDMDAQKEWIRASLKRKGLI